MRAIDDADAGGWVIESAFAERRGIGMSSILMVNGNKTVGLGQSLPMRETISWAYSILAEEMWKTPALAGVSGQKWLNGRAC